MKRILLLIPALNAGGAERVMVTLANEWSKKEDVTLMVFNDGDCFYELSRNVHLKTMHLMPSKKGFRRKLSIPKIELKRFRGIYREIKNGGYDFVLSFCYTTNMFASIVARTVKNVKVIISERNDPYGYSKSIRFLINVLYKRCNVVVCQNSMVKSYFTEKGFKNKLIILPNPVNFADIPQKRPQEIESSIVTVGRLVEQKNQKLLIEAFSDITDKFPEYSLKIYGIGPLKESLQELIDKKKLNDKVSLLGTKKKVMYEVNKCSVFVLSSDFEGFPNVLIEAMATGMPVISTDFKTGIARELIESEKSGYVIPTGNRAALGKALTNLLNRKSEFDEIGEVNRTIASQYKDNIIAAKWLEALSDL